MNNLERARMLIELAFDGSLSEEQRAELQSLAAADKGIATEWQDARQLMQAIANEVPSVPADLQLHNTVLSTVQPASKMSLSVVFALAAVALAVLGLWASGILYQGDASKSVKIDRGEIADVPYVLATQPQQEIVVLQDLEQFQVRMIRPGESLQHFTLQAVHAESLDVTDAAGQSVTVQVQDWNQTSLQKVEEEILNIRERYSSLTIQIEDVTRLNGLACFGNVNALRLLHTIADSNHEFAADAKGLYDAGMEARQIELLAKRVTVGSSSFRDAAIRALAQVRSPLALHRLKDLALELEDAPALLCVDMLARLDSSQAVALLRQVQEASGSRAVRQFAKSSAMRLIDSLPTKAAPHEN